MNKESMLAKLMSRFNGQDMWQKVGPKILSSILPGAQDHLEQLNKLENDGGLRKEGEEHIGYLIILVNKKPVLVTAAISTNENGKPELVRNIATIGMDQLETLQKLSNEQGTPE